MSLDAARRSDINSVNAVIRANPKYRASIKPGTKIIACTGTLDVCPPSCRFCGRFPGSALLRFLPPSSSSSSSSSSSFSGPGPTITPSHWPAFSFDFGIVPLSFLFLHRSFFARLVFADLSDRFNVWLLRWRNKIGRERGRGRGYSSR